MQKEEKSCPACESSSESSNKTPRASSFCCASCVSTAVVKDEDDVSPSTSATEETITP